MLNPVFYFLFFINNVVKLKMKQTVQVANI